MISLNLLPEKEKMILRRERVYQFIFLSIFIFVVGIIIISFELFFAKKILKDYLSIYTTQLGKEQEFVEEIKKINFKLITIDEIQSKHLEISPILVSLSKITPPFSYIKSFNLDREKKEFQIKGWAKTRKELLEFQNNLEKSEFFTKIEAPLSNLLREENVDFEFKGKLNL